MNKIENVLVNSEGYITIKKSQFVNKLRDNSQLRYDNEGRVIIASTHLFDKQKEKGTDSKASLVISNPLSSELENDYIAKPKKTKKKGKSKKKNKHKKQIKNYKDKSLKKSHDSKRKGELIDLKETCISESKPNIASITGELFSLHEHICVHENDIYLYDEENGCFIHQDESQTKLSLMKMFKKDERLRVWASDINNAYKTLLMNPAIQQDLSPRVNIPLVNCENGVLDMETMELLKHSPQFGFTSCINASFDEKADGNIFKQFLQDITDGDKDSKQLLQEIVGYSLSTYVYAKKAFIFYGVPHSGKSVLLNITERLVGSENVCHVDLQKLSEACYAARLNKSKLNIAPDLPQTPIKDIGTFKSLVSSLDKIETKELYKNPKSQPCYCKMLFGANQFVPLNKLDANNAEAFFERLIIIPFLYAKPVEERDPNLPEKLWAARDYIFTWAMKGLKRLIENNFIFSSSKESERVLERYKTQYCPEQIFFSKYLVLDENKTISRDKVQKKYEKFADERGVKVGCYDIKDFISRNYPQVKQSRKRINGSKNPLAVYEGLAFAD